MLGYHLQVGCVEDRGGLLRGWHLGVSASDQDDTEVDLPEQRVVSSNVLIFVALQRKKLQEKDAQGFSHLVLD